MPHVSLLPNCSHRVCGRPFPQIIVYLRYLWFVISTFQLVLQKKKHSILRKVLICHSLIAFIIFFISTPFSSWTATEIHELRSPQILPESDRIRTGSCEWAFMRPTWPNKSWAAQLLIWSGGSHKCLLTTTWPNCIKFR
jgi:hypothetical protein